MSHGRPPTMRGEMVRSRIYGERTLNAHCETHIVKRTTEEDWIILVYMNALLHTVYTEMRDDGDVSS